MAAHLLLDAIGVIVAIFALIGLAPRFDSTEPGAWGDDHDDKPKR